MSAAVVLVIIIIVILLLCVIASLIATASHSSGDIVYEQVYTIIFWVIFIAALLYVSQHNPKWANIIAGIILIGLIVFVIAVILYAISCGSNRHSPKNLISVGTIWNWQNCDCDQKGKEELYHEVSSRN